MLYIQRFIHDAKLNFCCIFNIAKNVLGEKNRVHSQSLSQANYASGMRYCPLIQGY